MNSQKIMICPKTAFLLALLFCVTPPSTAFPLDNKLIEADQKTIESEDSRVNKIYRGVEFYVEEDREIGEDPRTGILRAEGADTYAARKIKIFREELNGEMDQLKEKISELSERIQKLEALSPFEQLEDNF